MTCTTTHPVAGRFVLESRVDDIASVLTSVADVLALAGHAETVRFVVRAAMEEAHANAVEHGNRRDPQRCVTVDYAVAPSEVVVEVTDEGPGFDPQAVPDPTRPENVNIPSGRGIMLMRSFMSEVHYQPPGNRVRLVYRYPS